MNMSEGFDRVKEDEIYDASKFGSQRHESKLITHSEPSYVGIQ